MRRFLILALVMVALFASTACMGPLMGPTGVLFTDITSPGALGHTTTYQITSESDFESVAFVEGTSTGTIILSLIAIGNFGYGAAIEDALLKAPGATRLIDITVDTHLTSILAVYSTYTTKVRGRAVKMKRR
jgi:hypothetical protein